jgi:5-methylcytosine-specific restriction protein B
MKPGDVVFAKKGRSLIVGRGVITSDYYYDGNREYHPHLRKVEWKNKGEWKTDSLLAMKTLTNITRLPELVIYLNSMIDGDSDEQKTQIPTKNAYNPYNNDDFLKEVFVTQADLFALESLLLRKKNLILQGAPGVGKTYAARRLAYAIMG